MNNHITINDDEYFDITLLSSPLLASFKTLNEEKSWLFRPVLIKRQINVYRVEDGQYIIDHIIKLRGEYPVRVSQDALGFPLYRVKGSNRIDIDFNPLGEDIKYDIKDETTPAAMFL
jgi:hypothetical protein